MDARRESEPTPMKNRTTVKRKSERELVVTRTFNGPARIVFEAWTKPELFRRWWVPKSMGMSLRSCEMDVRVGGTYRLEFEPDGMAFFGTYLEVTPHSRLVWTNEEGGEGGPVTTVTFEEQRGKTLLVLHELYSSKEALDAAGTGAADAMVETFAQLDELLLGRERGTVMKSSRMRAKTDNAKTATKLLVALTGKASPAKAAEGDEPVFRLHRQLAAAAARRRRAPVTPVGMGKSTRGVELASVHDLDALHRGEKARDRMAGVTDEGSGAAASLLDADLCPGLLRPGLE